VETMDVSGPVVEGKSERRGARVWDRRETGARCSVWCHRATGGAAGKAARLGRPADQTPFWKRQEQPSKASGIRERIFAGCAGVRLHGGYTIVKDYVRLQGRERAEMFVPLPTPLGKRKRTFEKPG